MKLLFSPDSAVASGIFNPDERAMKLLFSPDSAVAPSALTATSATSLTFSLIIYPFRRNAAILYP